MRLSDWSSDVCSADLASLDSPCSTRRPSKPIQTNMRHNRALVFSATGVLRVGFSDQPRVRAAGSRHVPPGFAGQIGRASCRERVCGYVLISVVGESAKTKTKKKEIDKIEREPI